MSMASTLQEDLQIAAVAAAQRSHILHVQHLEASQDALELFGIICQPLRQLEDSMSSYRRRGVGAKHAAAGNAGTSLANDAILLLPPQYQILDASVASRLPELLQVQCLQSGLGCIP